MGIGNIFKRIFGTSHERMLRKIQPTVEIINRLEPDVSALSDEELVAQTAKFKQRIENGASLDDILPEAFATVREASKRVLGMRHYDVQLIGGIALHRGMIAEMKTGEGKTLVATSPMYLNALSGKGAHLVTVNDYLAGRDADWMGQIYKFLGLSVGKILTDLTNEERRAAYAADITYGTNNEFGFDYLRDNMKYRLADYVQRGHNFAIVDEVDSILIDEARTPLIISGQIEQDLNLYYEINKIVPFLKRDEDYTVDEKASSVALNESGIEKVEKYLKIDNIYDPKYIEHLHHVNKALQAHTLYKLDQNYVVDNGKVVIVDDFTGRLMPGRRWSDGLHQAIEAKEGVEIQAESRTLATITFQNYFRMYDKLAGMTGTADTEAEEFKKIYKLDVFSIPTSRPIVRKDYHDVVYIHETAKISAVVKQIKECHEKGQPVLVGTVSVEKSEVYSKMLTRAGIEHNVLNAKNHRREAEIIAQAGREGAVTIATNMAGRGTDILLGGNPEALARADESMPYEEALVKYKAQCAAEKERVQAAGGLFILGTERHESRRIDNQLRGRAGRQGDPGASRFYLSFDDDLLRIFGGDKFRGMMESLTRGEDEEDVAIESSLVTHSIETAQRRVEGRNFDIRKSLIEYDDVMNKQRNAVYGLRLRVLKGEDLEDLVLDAFEDVTVSYADKYLPEHEMYEDWNFDGFLKAFAPIYGYRFKVDTLKLNRDDREGHIQIVFDEVNKVFNKQIADFDKVVEAFDKAMGKDSPYAGKTGKDLMLELAQNYYLKELDASWQKHLTDMTGLRESISFRGYAQKDPKQEYKREAFDLFEKMMRDIKIRLMTQVSRSRVEIPDLSRIKPRDVRAEQPAPTKMKVQENLTSESKAESKAGSEEKPRKSLSMAEMMAQGLGQRRPEQKAHPQSMAEIMAASGLASKKEESKKNASMADLMPSSMMQAMLDIEAERKRMREAAERAAEAEELDNQVEQNEAENEEVEAAEQAPQRSQSMADLMPVSMMEAMKQAEQERRRFQERMAREAEAAAQAEQNSNETDDADNTNFNPTSVVSDVTESMQILKNKLAQLTEGVDSESKTDSVYDEDESTAIDFKAGEKARQSIANDETIDAPAITDIRSESAEDILKDAFENTSVEPVVDINGASVNDDDTVSQVQNAVAVNAEAKTEISEVLPEAKCEAPVKAEEPTKGASLFDSLKGLSDLGDDDFGFDDLGNEEGGDLFSSLFGKESEETKQGSLDFGSLFNDDDKI